MDAIRMSVAGEWGHAGGVLEELEGVPGVEVVGLAKVLPDDLPERWRQHAVAAHAPVFDDFRRMLREARPHVVVVGTRLDRIAPVAVEAALAGCHLICEKPLALDLASLEGLRKALDAKRVHAVAMLPNEAHPVLLAARRAFEEGMLGDVVLVNARKSYKWGRRPDWFGDRSLYGGTIPWVGIHAFDYILSVTGLRFERVAAMQSNLAHPGHPGCEDNAVVMGRLDNGAHVSVSLDLCRPEAAPTHGDDGLRIVGTRGVLEANLTAETCCLLSHGEGPRELPLPSPPGFYAPLLRALREGNLDPWRRQEAKAFLLTRTVLAAREAADQDRIVHL